MRRGLGQRRIRELVRQFKEYGMKLMLEQICRALDCRPLRIRRAAALVREDGIAFDELARSVTSPEDLDALTLNSIKKLSVSQQQVLGVLATLDGAVVTAQRLASLARIPNAQQVADSLCQRVLVERVGDGYRLCRDLIDSVRQKVSPEWTIKLILCYRKLAEQNRSRPSHLLPETEAILQTLQKLIRGNLWADAIAIARGIEGTLALTGQWDAWGKVLDAALMAARELGDRREEAWGLHQQGVRSLCMENAHTAKVQLATALQMRTSQGDTAGAEATRQTLKLVEDVFAQAPEPVDAGVQRKTTPIAKLVIGLAATAIALLIAVLLAVRQDAPPMPIAPLAITHVSIDPEVYGGDPTRATIALNRPGVSNGGDGSHAVVETVVDDPALVRAPRTIAIPPGQSEVTVPLETAPVAATRRVKLTVTHAGVGQETTIVVRPKLSLELGASVARGGQIVPATLQLRAPAPPGGLRIPVEVPGKPVNEGVGRTTKRDPAAAKNGGSSGNFWALTV